MGALAHWLGSSETEVKRGLVSANDLVDDAAADVGKAEVSA